MAGARVPVYVSDPEAEEANKLLPVGPVDLYTPRVDAPAPLYSPDGALLTENRLVEPSDAPVEKQSTFSRSLNRLLGTQFGEERFQTWPEKMVRSGASLAHDVATGAVLSSPGLRREDVTDLPRPGGLTVAAEAQDDLIQRVQDMAGLAMTGGLAGTGERGMVVGSGPVRNAPMPENKPAPVWYSPTEHALESTTNARATGAQWLATLRNSRGVKPEELDWTGLRAFLEERADKPVSRPELHEYLRDHRVELQDVTKGGEKTAFEQLSAEDKKWLKKQYEDDFGVGSLEHENDLKEYYNQYQGNDPDAAPATKYHSYQLPGGENYREHLITLPGAKDLTAMEGQQLRELDRIRDQRNLTNEELARYWDLVDRAHRADNAPSQYKSSHWDEPNIVAHVRSNVREMPVTEKDPFYEKVIADVQQRGAAAFDALTPKELQRFNDIARDRGGQKFARSLHLEEVQSDWHQAGRRKGYENDLTDAETAELRTLRKKIDDGTANGDDAARSAELENKKQAYGGVPNAPWKKTWHELALKRMIRLAAEEGMDRVSWTPGEAQAARYDLSKQLDVVHLEKIPHDAEGRFHLVARDKKGATVMDKRVAGPEELADNIGKEAAEKLLSGENKERLDAGVPARLENADLKIGGEGMRGFYDKMMVQAAEKLGKEYGVKVKKGSVPVKEVNKTVDDRYSVTGDKRIFDTREEALKAASEPIWYFDIPPAMREAALGKGMPLFSGGKMFVPHTEGDKRSERDD